MYSSARLPDAWHLQRNVNGQRGALRCTYLRTTYRYRTVLLGHLEMEIMPFGMTDTTNGKAQHLHAYWRVSVAKSECWVDVYECKTAGREPYNPIRA